VRVEFEFKVSWPRVQHNVKPGLLSPCIHAYIHTFLDTLLLPHQCQATYTVQQQNLGGFTSGQKTSFLLPLSIG